MIQQSLNNVQIMGKDAPQLAELMSILQKALDKAMLSLQKKSESQMEVVS
jgi:hypothetical protein